MRLNQAVYGCFATSILNSKFNNETQLLKFFFSNDTKITLKLHFRGENIEDFVIYNMQF